MDGTKVYVFRDSLFCYVCIVLALCEEDAREYAGDVRDCEMEVLSPVLGLCITGGGNG